MFICTVKYQNGMSSAWLWITVSLRGSTSQEVYTVDLYQMWNKTDIPEGTYRTPIYHQWLLLGYTMTYL